MITLSALLLNLAGAVLVYLASGQQQLLKSQLHITARLAGWLLIFAGTACWMIVAGTGAGISAALTSLMLAWVMLPYLAWWRGPDATETNSP